MDGRLERPLRRGLSIRALVDQLLGAACSAQASRAPRGAACASGVEDPIALMPKGGTSPLPARTRSVGVVPFVRSAPGALPETPRQRPYSFVLIPGLEPSGPALVPPRTRSRPAAVTATAHSRGVSFSIKSVARPRCRVPVLLRRRGAGIHGTSSGPRLGRWSGRRAVPRRSRYLCCGFVRPEVEEVVPAIGSHPDAFVEGDGAMDVLSVNVQSNLTSTQAREFGEGPTEQRLRDPATAPRLQDPHDADVPIGPEEERDDEPTPSPSASASRTNDGSQPSPCNAGAGHSSSAPSRRDEVKGSPTAKSSARVRRRWTIQ
jgi:hypothetical protein